MWKDIIAEHDSVTMNFTKSGSHDNSFTKAVMRALVRHNNDSINGDSISSCNKLNSDEEANEEADEFGIELGVDTSDTNHLNPWLRLSLL
jgi:hypothetical protein